jgi:hypothetical protein
MRWSKNITEERDAPEQIILGSIDPRICPLLNLATFLEVSGRDAAAVYRSEYVFGNATDGHRIVRQLLNNLFEKEGFQKLKAGNLGTHSLRKGPATYASRCGLAKDFVSKRGRWRAGKAIVDVYIDTTLPYPDACTAAILCGPLGACKYRIKPNLNVDDTFLIEHIAVATQKVLGDRVANILALPLLWAAYEEVDTTCFLLSNELRNAIRDECDLYNFNFDQNPVERVGIHPTGHGSEMNLIELAEVPINGGNGDVRNISNDRNSVAVMSQQMILQRRLEEMNSNILNEMARIKSDISRRIDAMNMFIKRIAIQPVIRSARAVSGDDVNVSTSERLSPSTVSKLSKCPRDLYALWHEYEFGCEGRKPAKCFTALERGANKFAYSRRKIFWDMVSTMVRSGHTSDAAIDKIYAVYGKRLSVSSVLLRMRADRKTGGNAALQN